MNTTYPHVVNWNFVLLKPSWTGAAILADFRGGDLCRTLFRGLLVCSAEVSWSSSLLPDLDASFPWKKLYNCNVCLFIFPRKCQEAGNKLTLSTLKTGPGDQSSDPVAVVRASADPGINLGTPGVKITDGCLSKVAYLPEWRYEGPEISGWTLNLQTKHKA